MAATYLKILFLLILLCFVSGGHSGLSELGYLQVPEPEFEGKVGSTIGVVRQVITTLSNISRKIDDFGLINAVNDCLDLMDFSVDLLSSALAISKNAINGKDNSPGNPTAKMRCKLDAVLINQETCKQGFQPCQKGSDIITHSNVESLISSKLDEVTSSVKNILTMVNPNPTTKARRGKFIKSKSQFPDWLNSHDQKLLQSGTGTMVANAVVATDGTGNFTTIKDAVNAAPLYSKDRYVIYIKRGVYEDEYVRVDKSKWNIMMIGDGIDATVISGNRSCKDGWKTYCSATFGVKGEGFIARDITFENTAGPGKGQAVAFVSDSYRSVLYRCAFRGYQDTLYPHSCTQFYRECQITGTVDFIFGYAAAVFQNCEITARKGLPSQANTVTANGRDSTDESGFSIQFCNISADQEVLASLNSTPTYLGRPWRQHSRTVIMESYISNAIRPEGWLEWGGNERRDTLFYGEYNNHGPGSGVGARVKWPGYHVITDPNEAKKFTVGEFIMGDEWLPSTGVTYTPGLGDGTQKLY